MQIPLAARILCCRALGHVAAGRQAPAWRDILAIHRLGRLYGGFTPWIVTHYCSLRICRMADDATRHLLAAPGLTAEMLAEIRRDLDAVGPPSGSAPAERLMDLDFAVELTRMTGTMRRKLCHDVVSSARAPWVDWVWRTSLDWNVVLEEINAVHDATAAALGGATIAERSAAIARLERAKHARTAAVPSGWHAAGRVLLLACSRERRSEAVAHLLVPSHPESSRPLAHCQTAHALTRTAAALAAWRADRAPGDEPYPDTLDRLVPRYLAAVPLDPFSDKPLVYEPRDAGYRLASAGVNGVHDGGGDDVDVIIRPPSTSP